MSTADLLRRLYAHAALADAELERALLTAGTPANAWREYTHILGAYDIWQCRLSSETPRIAVFPALEPSQATAERERLHATFHAMLSGRTDAELDRIVKYGNLKGDLFDTDEADILQHVAMHAHYHRGKVNALLRRDGHEPVAVDYILFARRGAGG